MKFPSRKKEDREVSELEELDFEISRQKGLLREKKDQLRELERGKGPSVGERVGSLRKLVGGSISKEEKNELYFGRPRKSLYIPRASDSEPISTKDIHKFGFTRNIYPQFSHKEGMAIESLHSDSKADLIKELVSSGLDRRSAEQTVNSLIERGVLVEVNDRDFGKILVFRR